MMLDENISDLRVKAHHARVYKHNRILANSGGGVSVCGRNNSKQPFK
jgi:hypothetical protein